MDWIQLAAFFVGNASLVLWFRTESRNDWRHMDNHIRTIQEEMKDFHARLALQDQEFKMRMGNLEEKGRK